MAVQAWQFDAQWFSALVKCHCHAPDRSGYNPRFVARSETVGPSRGSRGRGRGCEHPRSALAHRVVVGRSLDPIRWAPRDLFCRARPTGLTNTRGYVHRAETVTSEWSGIERRSASTSVNEKGGGKRGLFTGEAKCSTHSAVEAENSTRRDGRRGGVELEGRALDLVLVIHRCRPKPLATVARPARRCRGAIIRPSASTESRRSSDNISNTSIIGRPPPPARNNIPRAG